MHEQVCDSAWQQAKDSKQKLVMQAMSDYGEWLSPSYRDRIRATRDGAEKFKSRRHQRAGTARYRSILLGALRCARPIPSCRSRPSRAWGSRCSATETGSTGAVNSDWDLVPDLHDFVEAIDESFRGLCRAADEAQKLKGELKVAQYNNSFSRLSVQDNDFLLWETASLAMHVSGVQIFDAGPLRNSDGGVDFARIKRATEAVLHRIPRYRQKIRWIPGHDRAVWVDDAHFNVDYHLRHISLPRPGAVAQLKRFASRIMEDQLDRSRPL